jgi:hypothetical protein
MVATVLREVLGNLELKYPPGAPALITSRSGDAASARSHQLVIRS